MKMRENNDINLSEIRIAPVRQNNGLVAFASVVINKQISVNCLGIYTCPSSPDGFRITYPTKLLSNGTKINILYPINKEAGLLIQKQIVREYLKLVEELTKGGI